MVSHKLKLRAVLPDLEGRLNGDSTEQIKAVYILVRGYKRIEPNFPAEQYNLSQVSLISAGEFAISNVGFQGPSAEGKLESTGFSVSTKPIHRPR